MPGHPSNSSAFDPDRCVVLVLVGSYIEPACESSLRELEDRGYAVWRVRGYSAVDQGRNQLATDAMEEGFDETMWIDSDIAFDPNSVEHLRSHGLPITCGVYPKKGKRELAIHVMPGTQAVVFGHDGGLQEIRYGGAGFLHVRRAVYEAVQEKLQLPVCNKRWRRPMVPFFQPLVQEEDDGSWYLAEDFAFCERVRRCGFKIMADTSFRLGHIGSHCFSWEEAGIDPRRFSTFSYHFQAETGARKLAEPGGTPQSDADNESISDAPPSPRTNP